MKAKKEVICLNCGKRFLKYNCYIKLRKNHFCSSVCLAEWQKDSNNFNWRGGLLQTTCDYCDKSFKRKINEIKKYKTNYCSVSCRIRGSSKKIKTICEYCEKVIIKNKADLCNHSFCNRECRHKWMKGENNPAWMGGRKAEPYCSVWSDKEYKEDIKTRDGHMCLNPICLKTSDKLVVHHVNYNKKDCRPSNLITICNSCNSRANAEREWHEEWYQKILGRRG